MAELDSALADRLVADLTPVRRLHPPLMRAAFWIGVMLLLAAAFSCVADLGAMAKRLTAASDMWLTMLGSTLTAGLAAVAAFELCLPDRSRRWALLPLPGLALWIGASGVGCARSWLIPGTHEASWAETRVCLSFIVGLSIPISLLTFAMLRRAYTLVPTLTSTVAGLAVAAAAGTLLNFFHPYDASLDDLVVHATAVLIVIGTSRFVGSRTLRARGASSGIRAP